jgi:hypothetical protein
LSIHVVGIIGLVLIFIIGTLRPINLGTLSLVMTFLIGTIFVGEGLKDMYSGFPIDLLVLLAGVTYLFAIAANNGTVERIVGGGGPSRQEPAGSDSVDRLRRRGAAGDGRCVGISRGGAACAAGVASGSAVRH